MPDTIQDRLRSRDVSQSPFTTAPDGLCVEAADRIDALETALRKIEELERTAYSLRAADVNFKEAGKSARAALEY